MKSRNLIIIIVLAITIISSCQINSKKDISSYGEEHSAAKIRFRMAVHDFGKINEGDTVNYIYTFENVGNKPLIILDAYASCGCTTPSFSNKPVLPGKKSAIKITFDSKTQVGLQQKVITIVSNAVPSTSEVYLTGEVVSRKF